MTDFFPGMGGEGRRAEALGSYKSLLCPILSPKGIFLPLFQVSGFIVSNL